LDYKSLEIWSVEELSISTARLLKNSLAIANGHRIHILDIVEEKILPGLEMSFEHELCALEIFSDFSGTLFLAVGEWITWNVSIVECSTASMTVIQDQLSPSDIQPRSLMFCQFTEDVAYFFIGRGDGNVDYFQFDQMEKKMCEAKRIPLGTRLVTFTQFHAHDQVYVFACSDRPCVIFCRNGKLLFSNVNIPDAVDVCPFVPAMLDGATGATDCLMVVTATSLLIGQLEDIQKIHFTSIPLGFQVFRLV
jgi:DNA damage-binding protein 1